MKNDELVEKILRGMSFAEAARQLNIFEKNARRIFYKDIFDNFPNLYCQGMSNDELEVLGQSPPSKKWEVKTPSLEFLRKNKDRILPGKTCATCCFFKPEEGTDVIKFGDCLRYPPRTHIDNDEVEFSGYEILWRHSITPTVKPSEFCGEWTGNPNL